MKLCNLKRFDKILTDLSNFDTIDEKQLNLKNFEMIEIINKLNCYSKNIKNPEIKQCYIFSILLIKYIIFHETNKNSKI